MTALLIGAAVAVALLLALLRLFSGPTLHDRALAAKTIVMRAALICAALAVAAGRSEWLDTALAIVFAALVLALTMAKVFRARTFQAPLSRAQEEA
jgi:multisubunit Na+/H+ antiporter MnhF subunit